MPPLLLVLMALLVLLDRLEHQDPQEHRDHLVQLVLKVYQETFQVHLTHQFNLELIRRILAGQQI